MCLIVEFTMKMMFLRAHQSWFILIRRMNFHNDARKDESIAACGTVIEKEQYHQSVHLIATSINIIVELLHSRIFP